MRSADRPAMDVESDMPCESGESLASMTKEQLIDRVKCLQEQLTKLQKPGTTTQFKQQRPFDFSRYHKVHIALKFLYLGWKFDGFVKQETTSNTIEDEMFNALIKIKLIESRETSNYHRCGRTDIGVSAFSQVISLTVRGLPIESDDLANNNHNKKVKREPLNYPGLLNRVLPPEIRAVAWAPVPDDFSARFSCVRRMYKYIFPRANLDIERMNEAAGLLVGEHDFRNFCKFDKNKLTHVRLVTRADVNFVEGPGEKDDFSFAVFTIISNAFLWHQIRCIMEVLFLVGEGKEEPTVIKELLDLSVFPCKPQYALASGLPLCLFDTEFAPEVTLDWNYDDETVEYVLKNLHDLWTEHSVKSHMIKLMVESLSDHFPRQITSQLHSLKGERSHQHKKLKFRPVEGSKSR